MQAAAADPATVAIVEAAQVEVDVACELETDDGWTDISDDLVPAGSSVELGSYRTIHRTCKLSVSRRLDWGKDRVRLSMTLTGPSGGLTAPLGVFLLSTPATQAGEDPKTYAVEGYDLLELLDQPHGQTFVAAAGTGYLANARTLIEAAGLTVSFADEQADRNLAVDRVWPLDESTTTLQIVNGLLAAVGFRGLNVGPEGTARSQPYQPPSERGVEWTYDAGSDDTTVGEQRTGIFDFFDAPNRLVARSSDPDAGIAPVTLNNVDQGVTSQDARGRIITTVREFEAADTDALTSQATEAFDLLSSVTEEFVLSTSPNPLHGHQDVVQFVDPELGVSRKCVVRSWQLPLDGSDMSLDLRGV